MAGAINRTQFLRGDLRGERSPLRPPWAIEEEAFVDSCDGCSECIRVCPTQILKSGRGKLPLVDFSHGACLFCADCVTACKPAALKRDRSNWDSPWTLKAHFGDQCLAFRGITCQSCEEPCEPRAIRFRPVLGGVSRPRLDTTLCNGCGECYAVCPVTAIAIRPQAA